MRLSTGIASTTDLLFILSGIVGVLIYPSGADSSPGSIAIFSDASCTDLVVSQSGSVPLDACIPGSATGGLSLTFIVSDKPFCDDGHRPDLVLFEDPCCSGYAIADYIPNARYGDYGNGSCQHLIGGGFRAAVFVCGKFQVPTPSVIAASYTFPSPSQTSATPLGACLAAVTMSTTGDTSTSRSLMATGNSTTFPSTSTTASSSASSQTSDANHIGVVSPALINVIICFITLLAVTVY